MSKFDFNDERYSLIQEMIKENRPITEIARRIGCQYSTLKFFLKRENIEYHGNPSRKGLPHIEAKKEYKSAQDYVNSVITLKSKWLIPLLVKERGYRKCEICQNEFWNGQPIPLEIHHVDGNHNNRDIKNIKMICPNCHAQTDNYKSKNMKK